GAMNAIFSMGQDEISKGVATHSSGNHAQAVALGAKTRGTKAWIVMPRTAPEVKKAAVLGYGAEVITCEPTLEARESTLKSVVADTGAQFIHPFDDWRVITGQATAAKELIEEVETLDALIAPVGGGGLLSGTALSTHYLLPEAHVYAGEPTGADDAARSFQAGRIIPSTQPQTLADGLLTSISEKTFAVIQHHVKNIFTVSDEEIVAAMRMIWERMKIIIEPSCAVPFAAVLQQKEQFAGQRIGIILTGGNVDLGKLPFK
ncbi:MAG: pyridoxal-phosphate dependent enzyme, partial [Bacteroidota bacterium]